MRTITSLLRAGAAIVVVVWFSLGSAAASELFIGTMRAPVGSLEEGGHLYRVELADGSARLIGRILVDGAHPVGITGMAFHPLTNVLYAITVGINDASRASLLTIAPTNAEAHVVARLSKPLSDISFAPDGRLFGWTMNTGQLALVDLGTGSVTTLGNASAAPVAGAFAIDSDGKAYLAPWSKDGRLTRVDLQEGITSPGPPVPSVELTALRSMAFSAAGELFAAHSVRTGSSASTLLRIDTATGQAIIIGDIPEDSEAIAVSATQSMAKADLLRRVAYTLLGATLLGLAAMTIHDRRLRRGGSRREEDSRPGHR